MALRYQLPIDLVGKGFGPVEDLRPLPAMRAPVVVKFRRDGDYEKTARKVLDNQHVLVDAAFCAGKSVRLPGVLAMQMKGLVVHVVPNPLLAEDLFNYITKLANEASHLYPPLYKMDIEGVMPKSGWLICGAVELVGKLLVDREALSGALLYLDEAHESEAYTTLMSDLALQFGARNVVKASATHGPTGHQQMEAPGELVRDTYPPEMTPEVWDVFERGKPWTAGAVTDNILVFTDSVSQATKILDQYQTAGFLTFRLTARMTKAKFNRAMSAMRDRSGPLVAIVADKTFRSGFTFSVSHILDTGTIAYYDPAPGKLRKLYRAVYHSEAAQTAARGARLPGLRTVYHRPEGEMPKLMCDLEPVEAEALAYLYRTFGFVPAGPLQSTTMAHASLPGHLDMVAVLNGGYPITTFVGGLGACAEQGIQDAVEAAKAEVRAREASKKEGKAQARPSSGASWVSTATCTTARNSAGSRSSLECPDARENVGIDGSEKVDPWAFLTAGVGNKGVRRPVSGHYYYSPGLKASTSSPLFPQGLQSVYRYMAMDSVHVDSLRGSDRACALKLVLDRYNVLNVEMRALQAAVASVGPGFRTVTLSKDAKSALTSLLESVGALDAERTTCLRSVELLAGYRFDLELHDGLPDVESVRQQYYEAELRECLATGKGDPDAYADDLRGQVSEPQVIIGARPHRAIEHEVDRRAAREHKARGGTTVEVALPGWTGVKSVEWSFTRRRGSKYTDISSMAVVPGSVLSRITGDSRREYMPGRRVRELRDGSTEIVRYK